MWRGVKVQHQEYSGRRKHQRIEFSDIDMTTTLDKSIDKNDKLRKILKIHPFYKRCEFKVQHIQVTFSFCLVYSNLLSFRKTYLLNIEITSSHLSGGAEQQGGAYGACRANDSNRAIARLSLGVCWHKVCKLKILWEIFVSSYHTLTPTHFRHISDNRDRMSMDGTP